MIVITGIVVSTAAKVFSPTISHAHAMTGGGHLGDGESLPTPLAAGTDDNEALVAGPADDTLGWVSVRDTRRCG